MEPSLSTDAHDLPLVASYTCAGISFCTVLTYSVGAGPERVPRFLHRPGAKTRCGYACIPYAQLNGLRQDDFAGILLGHRWTSSRRCICGGTLEFTCISSRAKRYSCAYLPKQPEYSVMHAWFVSPLLIIRTLPSRQYTRDRHFTEVGLPHLYVTLLAGSPKVTRSIESCKSWRRKSTHRYCILLTGTLCAPKAREKPCIYGEMQLIDNT